MLVRTLIASFHSQFPYRCFPQLLSMTKLSTKANFWTFSRYKFVWISKIFVMCRFHWSTNCTIITCWFVVHSWWWSHLSPMPEHPVNQWKLDVLIYVVSLCKVWGPWMSFVDVCAFRLVRWKLIQLSPLSPLNTSLKKGWVPVTLCRIRDVVATQALQVYVSCAYSQF